MKTLLIIIELLVGIVIGIVITISVFLYLDKKAEAVASEPVEIVPDFEMHLERYSAFSTKRYTVVRNGQNWGHIQSPDHYKPGQIFTIIIVHPE